MQKKENLKKVEVEEIPSVFENGLLYGGYSVISNKTVRQNEKLRISWKNNNPAIPGKEMIKTNRGYFLDGYNIDVRSTNLWFALTKCNRYKKLRK